jgi:hypothetical protein
MYHYRAMLEDRCSVMVVLLAATAASAQPKPGVPSLVHAAELVKVAPTWGFIDDAIAGDDTRILYTVSDAATRCELHVAPLEETKKETIVDLAPYMQHPIAIPWQRDDLVWVVGQAEDGKQDAVLVSLSKRSPLVARIPPATHVAAIVQGGWKLAAHREVASNEGTRHEVVLYDASTGTRVATGRGLVLDANGANKALDFHVNHWTTGKTRAVGVAGGEWDKKENQRSPDVEATYDLVKNGFVDRKPITDLFDQRKRFQVLAEVHDRVDFVRVLPDSSAIEVWRDGRPIASELDQPLALYDPKSLQGIVLAGAGAWAAIKIDPVNPDAVARKKADPEYLDVFRATDDRKLQLGARVLATGTHYRFGVLIQRFWLLERSPSSERGGKVLTVYQIR